MKCVFISFLAIILFQKLHAQRVISTDKIVFTVPSKTIDITSVRSSKFEKLSQKFILAGRKVHEGEKLLEIGEMIFSISADNHETTENYLKDLRESYFYEASLLSKRKYKISKLKSQNNFKYFTSTYEDPNDEGVYIIYFLANNTKTKIVIGAAEYPKTSTKVSGRNFDSIINSLKFK